MCSVSIYYVHINSPKHPENSAVQGGKDKIKFSQLTCYSEKINFEN